VLTPRFSLLREDRAGEAMLCEVLNEVSKQAEVYVLLWSGSPLLFSPTVHDVEEACALLKTHAPGVRCALDRAASFSHDHHQKAVTIDGRIAYVGGMDLTTYAGDRWDAVSHHPRLGQNWHDVQLQLEGEAVQDVEENFCQRWNAVTGERLTPIEPPPRQPSWTIPAQVVRTVPAGIYDFAPDGKFGIFHALCAAIRGAERFIYLENQYLWAPEIVDALCEAMNRPRRHTFRILMVLPARAEDGKYDNDQHVELSRKEDRGRGMIHFYSLWTGAPGSGPTGFVYRPIYVHSKTSIVDDEWFSVGSANLNRRGLATDTEMNVQSIHPETAKKLRVELWSNHLGMREEEIASRDPVDLIDNAWPAAARATEDAIRRSVPLPAGHARVYVPGRDPRSRLLELVQDLTLEH
jgi:phosphatidylserine/phosphatidylglycerophosphate/cardiolipin synthase-like enzyme